MRKTEIIFISTHIKQKCEEKEFACEKNESNEKKVFDNGKWLIVNSQEENNYLL